MDGSGEGEDGQGVSAVTPVETPGGCPHGHGGGVPSDTGGVSVGTPKACSEAYNKAAAADAIGLYAKPAYDPEAVRMLVEQGVGQREAQGLAEFHKPTAAEVAVVIEVMDARDLPDSPEEPSRQPLGVPASSRQGP